MLAWKSICGIFPKRFTSSLFVVRQISVLPVINRVLARHGVSWEVSLLSCRANTSHSLRFFSSKTSDKKKESSVFQELVESQERPQAQLTVGAKGSIWVHFSLHLHLLTLSKPQAAHVLYQTTIVRIWFNLQGFQPRSCQGLSSSC